MSDEIFKFHGTGRLETELSNILPDEYEDMIFRSDAWPTISVSIPITQEEADAFLDLFEDPDWPNILN